MVQYEKSILFSSNAQSNDVNVTNNGGSMTVTLNPGISIPREAKSCTLECVSSSVWWTIPNIQTGIDDTFTIIVNGVVYNLVIDQGLYDVSQLSDALQREFVNAGGAEDTFELIADESTQKIIISLKQSGLQVDFTGSQSMREILGFDSAIYPPAPTTGEFNVNAPNVANFNEIDYFLLQTDLVQSGVAFNNQSLQTVQQILITSPPGSQIITEKFNPVRIDASNLIGSSRNQVRVWVTDQNNNIINTNGETFSALFVIRYEI